MKERSIHAGSVSTRQLKKVTSTNTSKRYMKERSTNAGNVITRQLRRVTSPNTDERSTKERSTHAVIVTTRQLQKVIWPDISILYIWVGNMLVICVNIKQLKRTVSRPTMIKLTRVYQYKHWGIVNIYTLLLLYWCSNCITLSEILDQTRHYRSMTPLFPLLASSITPPPITPYEPFVLSVGRSVNGVILVS